MHIRNFTHLPDRIHRMEDLAYNLRWSWHHRARELFKRLDPQLWKTTQHNPVRLLREIQAERLANAERDPDFLRAYETTLRSFDNTGEQWFAKEFPDLRQTSLAYFSAEFGLHTSLPIYSGGLGILAGDHCKQAADLGLPLSGVGFVYPQGYFHQRLRSDGWQEDVYELLHRDNAPIRPACSNSSDRCVVELRFPATTISVLVWRVTLGSVALFLMDTDVEENEPMDRELSARLYGGDKEHRIRQEIVLGIGGVRVLEALGIRPHVFHANEGHTSFLMLERIRSFVQQGASFDDAAERVRATTVFTTHTPVPAGHDAFPIAMVEKHFAGYWDDLGISKQRFMELGLHGDTFNMTALGMRLAGWKNAVSKVHEAVTRKMWHGLWPQIREEDLPVTSVTNGVHAPTWIAGELSELFDHYLGPEWIDHYDEIPFWNRVREIPDEELWNVHTYLKRKFLTFVREWARGRWTDDAVEPRQVIAMGTLLDPDALTIGFARRFTGYKRASLIFHDLERIKRILLDRWKPVQIVFAGKAHPADEHGKHLIHQIYSLAADHGMAGHVAFIENYEMHAAHFFTQGVDVWLNNPRQPLEACGTSGQKAGMNGILNVSILDGWWCEGHNGNNGWAVGDMPEGYDVDYDDGRDADRLYQVIEQQVVPLYYDRDHRGVPHGWIQMMKEAIRSIVPRFSASRMVKEYSLRAYVPAARASLKS